VNLAGVVANAKLAVGHTRLDVEGRGVCVAMQFDEQALVSALGEAALLIQQRKDAELALHKVEALGVVDPGDFG
jgi:VIT1/CCC1 family predicted Fe2+/Mn2+ transporter